MVYGTCTDSCTMTASSQLPDIVGYEWDLGQNVKVTTTNGTLTNPSMKHWCGTFGGAGTISVPVTVRAMSKTAGAQPGAGNVTVVQQS
jgi:hypothetical protein